MCDCGVSDVDDDDFRFGEIGEDADLRLRFLLQGMDDDFCVCIEPDEDEEATDDLRRFRFPLRALNSFRRVFLGIRTFFALRARGVSLSSHSRSIIFCFIIFSQEASFKPWVIIFCHDATQFFSVLIRQVVFTEERSERLVHSLDPAFM